MKIISQTFKTAKMLILGWGIIVPLTYLFPVKKNLVLFIGKNKGLFFDNVKYLYLYLHGLKQNGVEYYFFTENKTVYETLKRHNLPVLLHPTLRSICAMVRANVVISCSTPWAKNFKYHLSSRAKKVQLWHGIPLKRIGLLIPEIAKYSNSFWGKISNALRGKNYVYDLFVSTSRHITGNIFSKAVRSRNFIESGYPRNDIFFKEQLDGNDLLETDVESLRRINELRGRGFRSVLYAPTWDNPTGNPIKNGVINMEKLSLFARQHKVLFVFKFHPSISYAEGFGEYDNIIYYDSTKDIQPLLKISDVLVTDYSSVYMDYLLLNRPIIFFPYDHEKYLKSQDGLLFDYDSAVPGPICHSQDRLEETIFNLIINCRDDYLAKRDQTKKMAFKYEDSGASDRIWKFIMEHFLEAS